MRERERDKKKKRKMKRWYHADLLSSQEICDFWNQFNTDRHVDSCRCTWPVDQVEEENHLFFPKENTFSLYLFLSLSLLGSSIELPTLCIYLFSNSPLFLFHKNGEASAAVSPYLVDTARAKDVTYTFHTWRVNTDASIRQLVRSWVCAQ